MITQVCVNDVGAVVSAIKDVDPEELTEYLNMLVNGELDEPIDEPLYALTLKGWGLWSIFPTLDIHLKLLALVPMLVDSDEDTWPERADVRRLT